MSAIDAVLHRFANTPMHFKLLACICIAMAPCAVMAIDLAPLWDFSRPDVSEQRFQAALETADEEDALILKTQIARTHGLRKDFERARDMLREIEPAVNRSGAEAQVRFHLELGRTFASATHPASLLTSEANEMAKQSYGRALELARTAELDSLAIDAIHMFAVVDKAPADQLKWGEAALQVTLASQQLDARRWEASIRHNIGYALHQLGRYEEALDQFKQALVVRERGTNAEAIRVARWMIAWTLRSLTRNDEAMQMQLSLEKEAAAAGKPDPYVFEELEALHRATGDLAKAQHYSDLMTAARRK